MKKKTETFGEAISDACRITDEDYPKNTSSGSNNLCKTDGMSKEEKEGYELWNRLKPHPVALPGHRYSSMSDDERWRLAARIITLENRCDAKDTRLEELYKKVTELEKMIYIP